MLKTYDYQCTSEACKFALVDKIVQPEDLTLPCPACNGTMARTWGLMSKSSGVVGDECDIWIRHGLCNADGTPKRYTSKQEIRREEERRGLTNVVRHVGAKGSDKSKHTSRWV